MGIDLVAIMDHRWGVAEGSQLPTLLNSADNPIAELQDLLCRVGWFAPDCLRWQFEFDDNFESVDDKWRTNSRLRLCGPNQLLHVELCPQTLAIQIYKGWLWFINPKAPDWRTAIRKACAKFGALCDATRVIYVPDSNFTPSFAWDLAIDGDPTQKIENELRRKCGPPASSITDIYRELPDNIWEGDGYYIDVLPGSSNSDFPKQRI